MKKLFEVLIPMVTSKEKEKRRKVSKEPVTLPGPAHKIAAKGSNTEKIMHDIYRGDKPPIFLTKIEDDFGKFADGFTEGWGDEETAKVVDDYLRFMAEGGEIDGFSLNRWLLSHENDAAAVLDCMRVEPPKEIYINKVLSRAGSTKLVFLATWRLTQRQVVLKRLIGPPEMTSRILIREMQPHPLSMSHANIIETHKLVNSSGEEFLVEEYLPFLLSDDWRSDGIQEAANLLYDISAALVFLAERGLVHGDVKPDNIGKKGDRYILLDFGLCRPVEAFTGEGTATGSLRTRAPEQFKDFHHEEPGKVDVWALAATVFNALLGKFPLFDFGEKPPSIWERPDREKFEKLLFDRAEKEWEKRVVISEIPEPVRQILSSALERNPEQRCSAKELLKKASTELAGFIREPSPIGGFSPLDALQQLRDYLPGKKVLDLMPRAEKEKLQEKLDKLKSVKGFGDEENRQVEKLLKRLK